MKLGCDSLLDLSPDLLILVLIRLPHRQVLKCMFVSKSFCSIILCPKFVRAYCGHNPICLLLSASNTVLFGRNIYCCNLNPCGGQLDFFNLKNLSPSCINPEPGNIIERAGVTEIINGFLCYYNDFRAVLVNVFSGELTDLPSPHVLPNAEPKVFYFGFDPINCEYKLLCCTNQECRIYYPNYPVFYILTIGGDTAEGFSWRRLPPSREDYYPSRFQTRSVSVNGSLYWIEGADRNVEWYYMIISFDLTTEKFRSFLPPDVDREFFMHARLVQHRGRLSLLSCTGIDVIVVYTLETGHDHSYEWMEHSIILPVEFRGVPIPAGSLPTGNLLFADLSPDGDSVTPLYAYNHETDKLVRFGDGKFPEWKIWKYETNISLQVFAVEQNVEMLDVLISQFSPRY